MRFQLVAAAAAAVLFSTSEARAGSPVALKAEAVEALKAQGKKIRTNFPFHKNAALPGVSIGQLAVSPEQQVLAIFVEFANTPPGGPSVRTDLKYFDDMLFGTTYAPAEYAGKAFPTNKTLKNYYQENSYGAVNVVTKNLPSTIGWAKLAKPYEYYFKVFGDWNLDNGFGPYPANVQGLVIDAINAVKAANPGLSFANYAVNGVIPNLFVVVAGGGAEWSGTPTLMWSHSWDLSEGTGLNGGFVVDGVRVNNYAMMPEVGGDLLGFAGPADPPFPPTVGVYAHEYGHVLGLPDQYDYGYESQGTGAFSLMAGGSWGQYPGDAMVAGNSPSQMDAWSKIRLGFLKPVEVAGALNAVLRPVEQYPEVYKMVVPGSEGSEYFLFENRQQVGFDESLARRGLHGLAIYHVDETVLSRNYWRCNEAEDWKEARWTYNQKAVNGETHYAVAVIQADDQWGLEKGLSNGFAGDLYPGPNNVTRFGNDTFPNSSSYYLWKGNDPKYGYSGVTASGIAETSLGDVAVSFSFAK